MSSLWAPFGAKKPAAPAPSSGLMTVLYGESGTDLVEKAREVYASISRGNGPVTMEAINLATQRIAIEMRACEKAKDARGASVLRIVESTLDSLKARPEDFAFIQNGSMSAEAWKTWCSLTLHCMASSSRSCEGMR